MSYILICQNCHRSFASNTKVSYFCPHCYEERVKESGKMWDVLRNPEDYCSFCDNKQITCCKICGLRICDEHKIIVDGRHLCNECYETWETEFELNKLRGVSNTKLIDKLTERLRDRGW
jgi:hypothetical protein